MLHPTAIGRIADELLGGPADHDWEVVHENRHSVVLRSGGLIVKHRPSAFETESAALRYANDSVPDITPSLVAASREHKVLVMTDLGQGRSLADALLGGDPVAAAEFLGHYADSIARLHRSTWGESGVPETLHHDREDSHLALYSRALEGMRRKRALGDDSLRRGALAEVEPLIELTTASGPTVFTIGDMCPGNQVMTPEGLRLYDLEAAGFMHPSLDVAYLTIPFPTCWCAWDIPEVIRNGAVSRYLSAVPDPQLVEERIPDAEVFWTVASVLAGLRMDDVSQLPADLVAPGYRKVIAHRVERIRGTPAIRARFATFCDLLDSLSVELERRWGEVPPLELAPAFQAKTRANTMTR